MKGTRYTPQELRLIRTRRRARISWQRIGEELDRNPSALSTSRIVQAVLSGKASPDSPRIRRWTLEELREAAAGWEGGHTACVTDFIGWLGAIEDSPRRTHG